VTRNMKMRLPHGHGRLRLWGRRSVGWPARTGFAFLLFVLLLLISACGHASGSDIIVAGSTSVQPFAEVLAEEYMRLHPGVNIDIQGGGSAAGIMAANSGTAAIGMSSRALAGEEAKLWYVQIAKDGLAMIVNPKNTVGSLTLAQARDIYAGVITEWSALGGTASRIHVVAREDGSGTRSAFESMVMGKVPIVPRAIIQDSNGAVRQVISSDPDAIGFLSLGLIDRSVKAVVLDGVAPTRDNVVNGSYRLSRPFLFVALGDPSGGARQFVDFVLSADGKKILDGEGLVTAAGSPPR
jgi:phosphate transport system substrate-binding protein